MFKQIRPRIFLFAEILMPFLIPFFGFPAIYYFSAREWETFDIMYDIVLFLFSITCLTEIILGLVSFILLLVNLFKKNRPPYSVSENLILWIASIFSLINTIFELLIIAGLSIGQSV